MTNRIGDRPRFPLSNQRFDKGDAENISRYYEEIISRFTGSIYGQAWGCVSNPQFSIATVSLGGGNYDRQLQFGKCALLYSVPAAGAVLNATSEDKGPWEATIVTYDSTRSGQPLQSLSLTAAFTQGQRPWVLFKRGEVPTNLGNKARWDTSTNTEVVGAANLQESEIVTFRLSASYSTSDREDGWYRMAYIDSFSGSGLTLTPVVVPIHWMDSQYYRDDVPPTQYTVVASALAFPGFPGAVGAFGFNPDSEMPTLAKLLHWTIGKLGQHFSSTNTVQVTAPFADTYKVKPGAFIANYSGDGSWLSTPERGLLELHNDLATAEQDIIDLNSVDVSLAQSISQFMTRYMMTPRLLATMYVRPVVTSWPSNVTFTVTYDTSAVEPVSFSPALVPWTGSAVPTNQLAYRLSAVDGASDERKITLELFSSSYMLTSVNVVHYISHIGSLTGQSGLSVNQRYNGILPPGSNLLLTFVVEETEGSSATDVVTPFTVYIYGRNV